MMSADKRTWYSRYRVRGEIGKNTSCVQRSKQSAVIFSVDARSTTDYNGYNEEIYHR